METTFTEENGILKVALKGRFVAATSPEIRDLVSSRMERVPNVLFDMTNMTHIDSSGLGCLVQLLQRATTRGGVVKLACIQPHPRIVFNITKVFRVFDAYDSVEEAMASFKK